MQARGRRSAEIRREGVHGLRRGARVNYICPGGLDTKLMRKTVENFLPGKTYEEGCEIFSHAYLDNRLCTVEDVANAMLFLASDVSSHMIGDALCLDGGLAVDRK